MKQNDNRKFGSQQSGYHGNSFRQNAKQQFDSQRSMSQENPDRVESHEEDPIKVIDRVLEDMAAEMDKGFMSCGKAVAELFRAMCEATVKLPNMELHTDAMCIFRDDDGLTVVFTPDRKADAEGRKRDVHPLCHKSDDDEEEGPIYDGD